MPDAVAVIDVDEATFGAEVIERSHEVPVVVDFWADWCGPCKVLGPILEEAVAARAGEVVLAKVDVDRNQRLAGSFRVQGIPAVKAFRDGEVVDGFTGAVGPQQVAAFLDALVPTPADRAVREARGLAETDPAAAAEAYRRALDLDPAHRGAAIGLAGLVVDDDPDAAMELVRSHRPHPDAEIVASRAQLALDGGGDVEALRAQVAAAPDDGAARLALGRALAATKDYDEAIEHLLAAVRDGDEHRDEAREQLLSVFQVLGADDPRVKAARPKLAAALF